MAYRKLKLSDGTWEYIIGQKGVKIRDPKGKCSWVEKYTMHGLTKEEHILSCHQIFDADDDWAEIYPTGPGDVKKYIESAIL